MSYAVPGQRILIAEDDEQVARWLKRVFEGDGHEVEVAHTGTDGLRLALEQTFSLFVVDIDLPEMDGLSVVRRVREAGRQVPVLIMTGLASDADVERGLDAGADDFLTKPVSVQVLRARARAAMRRSSVAVRPTLTFGDISIDRATFRAHGPKAQVLLTAKEFDLLQYIIANATEVLPRKKLLLHVWGYNFDPGTNVLEVALSRVRHRLAEITDSLRLRTLRGQGVLLEYLPAGETNEDQNSGTIT